jgi:hypothetical protein
MGSWRSQGRHVRYRRRQALANPGVRKHDEKKIDLDQHRGMAAQKATDLRRLLADVEANERALRLRQDELEARLIATPAANWREAAEKARYLLNLFCLFPLRARSSQTETNHRRAG